jgi:LAGLIDADG endonuclease
MHKKDLELLKLIQTYFGGIGSIVKSTQDMCAFRVSSPEIIFQKILPYFDKYPLITQKKADYFLFKEVIIMMLQKEHLELKGLQKIVNIRASLNLGLSEVLKAAFPNTIPFPRPNVKTQEIPHPE